MRRVLLSIATAVVPLLLLTSSARAEVDVTFPLGEHYRIGKYFPVRVTSKGAEPVLLQAPGALTVGVSQAGPVDTVIPLLAIETIERDGWALRPLANDECLIATTSASPDASLAAVLFPGRKVVGATLSLPDPLPGSAMAWEVLDAVFLDAASAARVTEAQLATLMAAGTTVAVRTDGQPAGASSTWRREGDCWVARAKVPPTGGVVRPDAYAKLPPGSAGLPPRVRHAVVLGLVAFSIAAIGLSLWRARRAWMATVLLCGAAAGGIVYWRSLQPGIVENVMTERAGDATDRFTHYTAVSHRGFNYGCDDWSVGPAISWPVVWSDQHARQTRLVLTVDARGNPVWIRGELKRGQSMLVQTRTVSDQPPRSQQ